MNPRLRRRPAPVLLSATALLASLALSACGGGGGKSDDDVKNAMAKAFKTPIQAADVKLDASVQVKGGPQQGPIRLGLSGPYRSNGNKKLPSLDWDVSFAGGGQNVSGGLISTGDNAFVTVQGQSYELGTNLVKQVNGGLAKQSPKTANGADVRKQFGIDPGNWIKDAKDEGDQAVAGTPTKHYSAGVDVKRMLDDFDKVAKKSSKGFGGLAAQRIPENVRKQFADAVKNATFDLNVGKDGKIRQLKGNLDFSVPKDQRSKSSGVEGGKVTFALTFANIGSPGPIKAPSSARPLADLVRLFGGLRGLVPQAGGTGTGTTGQ